MKTYKTVVEKPRIEISYDTFAESPRENYGNLGYFITVDRNYYSPDDREDFTTIIEDTGEIATSQEDHIKAIKKEIEDQTNEKVLTIYPVVKYEHSGVVYRRGEKHGFDYSNNGFYIVTEESAKELGIKKKDFERIIDQELEEHTQWANGEVYQITIYDEKGELQDSCGGFYSIEDMQGGLPEDLQDEDLTTYEIK